MQSVSVRASAKLHEHCHCASHPGGRNASQPLERSNRLDRTITNDDRDHRPVSKRSPTDLAPQITRVLDDRTDISAHALQPCAFTDDEPRVWCDRIANATG